MEMEERTEKSARAIEQSCKATNYADVEKFLYCGSYQIVVAVIYLFACFVFAFNLIFMTFMILEPPWQCEPYLNMTSSSSNLSNVSLDDRCALLQSGQCTNITWVNVTFYSVVSEWNLVCDKKNILYSILSIQMGALLVGTPLIGRLADRFGRKPILCLSMISQASFGIATGFANTWQVFAVCRFFVGLFGAGLTSVVGVYVVENVSKSYRLFIMAIGGMNIGMILSSCLAFGFQHWRPLTMTASSAGFVALLLILFTCESPRWLILHGRAEQARRSYRYILRINGKQAKQMNDDQWKLLVEQAQRYRSKRASFWDIFRETQLLIRTSILSFAMFVMKMISTLLMFSMDDMAGSIYLNAVVYGLVNWLGGLSCSFIDRAFRRVGRKHMIGTLLSVVIVCTLGITVTKWLDLKLHSLERALVFIGAATSSPLWISFSLVTMESFPTSLRSTVSGVTSMLVNIGGLVIPQLLLLALKWKPIPWIVVTVLTTICLLSFLAKIPETKASSENGKTGTIINWRSNGLCREKCFPVFHRGSIRMQKQDAHGESARNICIRLWAEEVATVSAMDLTMS
uniref:MFS domain-containing protein n=1 Tax=Trichuris muris TaxID=70415 RepID=A0A5S6R197_TRIMR